MNEVVVKFYSDIRGVIGTDAIIMQIGDDATIEGLVNLLCQKYPDSFNKVIYEPNTNKFNSDIMILLNKLSIAALMGKDTRIVNGDEIIFFAAVSGG